MPDTKRSGPTRVRQHDAAAGVRLPYSKSRRRARIIAAVVVVFAVVAAGTLMLARQNSPDTAQPARAAARGPVVGGDLHTLFVASGKIFVGGHEGAANSTDGGRTWRQVISLKGADPMGWAESAGGVFAGGHPGLFRSDDAGRTFVPVRLPGRVSDVHAFGGADAQLYIASPQVGLLASNDDGRTWKLRNPSVGQSFMGTILVEPDDHDQLLAPDMSASIASSSDGGLTWRSLGGPSGAMSVALKPGATDQLVAVGMGGAARSEDGGRTWRNTEVPPGTSALTFDAQGRLFAAALGREDRVRIFRKVDESNWHRLV